MLNYNGDVEVTEEAIGKNRMLLLRGEISETIIEIINGVDINVKRIDDIKKEISKEIIYEHYKKIESDFDIYSKKDFDLLLDDYDEVMKQVEVIINEYIKYEIKCNVELLEKALKEILE